MKSLAVVVVLLGLSQVGRAEDARRVPAHIVGGGYAFGSSANAPGQFNAYFKTRLVLTNPNLVSLSVIAQLSTPAGPSQAKIIVLAPAETRVYENFLDDVFGYVGAAGIGLIESTLTRYFVAVGEVYAENANGRFSTPLLGLFTDDRVVRSTESGFSLVSGLRVNSTNRANMGCTNMDSESVSVRADVYGPGSSLGSPSSSVTLDLVGFGFKQVAVPIQGDPINVLFVVTSGGGSLGAYCYGVNVNNQSNDGTWVPAGYIPYVP